MCASSTYLLFSAFIILCLRFSTGFTGLSQFVKVGCFNDQTTQRALPDLIANFRNPPYADTFPWSNLSKIVDKCAREVAKKNYMYFSIQYYGECWSGPTAPLTYDRYGATTACTPEVGKSKTNMVYRFVGKEGECLSYSVLNSTDRSTTYALPKGISPLCDFSLPPSWYRFMSPAGDRMATSCVNTRKCGTVVTGFLNSSLPKMTEGIVGGKACFHFGSECCQWDQIVQVRNCGRFFVYKLNRTSGCPMRFCAV